MIESAWATAPACPSLGFVTRASSWYGGLSQQARSNPQFFNVVTVDSKVTRLVCDPKQSSAAIDSIQEIRRLIAIRDVTVDSFLLRNPFLQESVLEVRNHLLDYLPGSTLSLEHFLDPEEGDQFLVLYVRSCYTSDIAAEKLDTFLVDWWCANIDMVKGKLSINLKFSDDI